MPEKISFQISGNDIIRRILVKGRGVKTSKLPIPAWVDRTAPLEDIYDQAWLASSERPRVRVSAQEIRAVDLFCGCGGLTLGIREAARGLGCAFRSVFASDINKGARELYQKNFQPDILDGKPIETRINGELGAPLTPEETQFCPCRRSAMSRELQSQQPHPLERRAQPPLPPDRPLRRNPQSRHHCH